MHVLFLSTLRNKGITISDPGNNTPEKVVNEADYFLGVMAVVNRV